jgi:hypothetical protein
VLALLDSLAKVAMAPASSQVLHELAYLANVLAPVFDLEPLDAKLLKRRGGPYYPELQHAIDALVGRGVVDAKSLRYEFDPEEKRYRIVAEYKLRRDIAAPALIRHRELFAPQVYFLDELAAAYAVLDDAFTGRAARHDARYADRNVDVNNVIDFGEWVSVAKNFSRNAALAFAPSINLLPAERLYLYLDHLSRKVAHVG